MLIYTDICHPSSLHNFLPVENTLFIFFSIKTGMDSLVQVLGMHMLVLPYVPLLDVAKLLSKMVVQISTATKIMREFSLFCVLIKNLELSDIDFWQSDGFEMTYYFLNNLNLP